MTKLKKHKINLFTAIITMVGILILTSISCKSPTTPEATEASITITNHCGIAVDILMDGVWQLTIDHLQSSTLSIPTLGVYEFEARKQGTGTVVSSSSADINEYKNFVWTVQTSADISIINNYGETIDIYGDGDLQGSINDQETGTLSKTPYGEHLLEATKSGETDVITSITLDITENIQYTWTVTK